MMSSSLVPSPPQPGNLAAPRLCVPPGKVEPGLLAASGEAPRRRTRSLQPAILGLALLMGLVGGCRRHVPAKAPAPADPGKSVKIVYPSTPGSFVRLVQSLSPSVVQLSTSVPVRGGPADWFPATRELLGGSEAGLAALHRSLGTGVIVDADGFILTCARVIQQAEEIWVQVDDKSRLRASLVGRDERTDLALLRVVPGPGVKLRAARLGDAEDLKPGEWVVVLGNPFGLGVEVSAGVVSGLPGLGPPAAVGPGLWGMLRLDAAVHAGNSGGPVVNMLGEVVGIAAAQSSDGGSGIGFAVPVNGVARGVMGMMRRDGRVVRGWLGMYVDRVTQERADKSGLAPPRGAFVTRVVPGGPAQRAGLVPGDILVSFDGQALADAADLPGRAQLLGPEKDVSVLVWRGGKEVALRLKTEAKPE